MKNNKENIKKLLTEFNYSIGILGVIILLALQMSKNVYIYQNGSIEIFVVLLFIYIALLISYTYLKLDIEIYFFTKLITITLLITYVAYHFITSNDYLRLDNVAYIIDAFVLSLVVVVNYVALYYDFKKKDYSPFGELKKVEDKRIHSNNMILGIVFMVAFGVFQFAYLIITLFKFFFVVWGGRNEKIYITVLIYKYSLCFNIANGFCLRTH